MMLPIYLYMLMGLGSRMYLDNAFALVGGLPHAAPAKPAAHD